MATGFLSEEVVAVTEQEAVAKLRAKALSSMGLCAQVMEGAAHRATELHHTLTKGREALGPGAGSLWELDPEGTAQVAVDMVREACRRLLEPLRLLAEMEAGNMPDLPAELAGNEPEVEDTDGSVGDDGTTEARG